MTQLTGSLNCAPNPTATKETHTMPEMTAAQKLQIETRIADLRTAIQQAQQHCESERDEMLAEHWLLDEMRKLDEHCRTQVERMEAQVAEHEALLGELMVCKRVEVEPEAITPKALEREGWKYDAGYDYPEPETFYIFKIAEDAAVSAAFVDGECKGIDVNQDDGFLGWSVQSVSFPGCDSMQKLRALVDMLEAQKGGAQ